MDFYQVASALNALISTESSSDTRNAATDFLTKLSSQPNAAQTYIKIMVEETATMDLRLSAALHFKILVTKNWNPGPDSPFPTICDQDKAWIKDNILDLALRVPDSMFKFIVASIRRIAIHEFPDNWKGALPFICEKLQSFDHFVILKFLKILNGMLKPYREAHSSHIVNSQLLIILQYLAIPIRMVFEFYSKQVDDYLTNSEGLLQLFQVIYLIFEIFNSLNSVDLPKEFEDFLEYWINEHCKYINFSTQLPELLPKSNSPYKKVQLVKLKTSAVRNMTLLIDKYEDDIEPYINTVVKNVWDLVNQVSVLPSEIQPSYDSLVTESLKFFNSAVKTHNKSLFSEQSILESIFEKLILPNLKFSPTLQETFELEPHEYIRLDIENINTFTRRRSAMDLIKGLRKHFDVQITLLSRQVIESLLSKYNANPSENWIDKDQAIYLLFALTVTSESSFCGAVSINPNIPLENFFLQIIFPELNGENIDQIPVIKADAIHFVYLFRSHLNKFYKDLIPLLAKFLLSNYSVVSSYAAIAIDSLVTLRNPNAFNEFFLPYSAFEPHCSMVLNYLFQRISNNSGTTFDNENPYIASALAHVMGYSREKLAKGDYSLLRDCLTQVTIKLSYIYKNSFNANFLHYLFDCIACILSILTETKNVAWIESAEEQLTPAFNTIFSEDIIDLIPYILQIIVQFIEIRKDQPDQLIKRYGSQLQFFLTPSSWERVGNIPALTRLIVAFIKFIPNFVVESGFLHNILGISKMLNNMKGYDQYGFQILKAIILHIDRSYWVKDEPNIYNLFFSRLRNNKTPGYINNLLEFWSELIYARDVEFVHHGMECVQKGILVPILTDIIIPSLPSVPYKYVHNIGVGMIKLWADPLMRTPPYVAHWQALTSSINKMILDNHSRSQKRDFMSLEEIGGFTNQFSKLTYTGKENPSLIDQSINLLELWQEKLAIARNDPTYPSLP